MLDKQVNPNTAERVRAATENLMVSLRVIPRIVGFRGAASTQELIALQLSVCVCVCV